MGETIMAGLYSSGGGNKPLKYLTGTGHVTIPIPRNKCKRLYGAKDQIIDLFPLLTMPIGTALKYSTNGNGTLITTTSDSWKVGSETANSFTIQYTNANMNIWYE